MEQLKEKIKRLQEKMGWAHDDLAQETAVSLSTARRDLNYYPQIPFKGGDTKHYRVDERGVWL
ncbi:hypothetical protein ACFLUU_04615 [Chloroflexota bacterium]